jgi:hypothetical protein
MAGASGPIMYGITNNSAGKFVAVGISANVTGYPVFSTSTDGKTWTTPTAFNGYTTGGSYMIAVTCSSAGRFMAVGLNNSAYVIYSTSTDGVTWTTPATMGGTTTLANAYYSSLAVNASGTFVFVGSDQSANAPLYAVSTNGTTWTAPARMNGSSTIANMKSVAVNSSGLFVALGQNTNNYPVYATSANGSTWTTPASLASFNSSYFPNGIIWSPALNKFVSVGFSSGSAYTTSTDGSTWTTPALIGSGYNVWLSSVVQNAAGRLVAVGYGTGSSVAVSSTSTDGSTWTTPANMGGGVGAQAQMYSVAVNSVGLYVAVGYGFNTDYPAYSYSY